MNITHIVPNIGYEANGVAPVVDSLLTNSRDLNHSVSIATISVQKTHEGISYTRMPSTKFNKKFEISLPILWHTIKMLNTAGIVHNHGLWSPINIIVGLLPHSRKCKLVISPHGTLSPQALRNKNIKKKFFWPLQKIALKRAALLHATSLQEAEDIAKLGLNKPIALIPNGVQDSGPRTIRVENKNKRILFISRIHPIKGLENLLEAWSQLEEKFPEWTLQIAGVGEDSYVLDVTNRSSDLCLKRTVFVGPLYGDHKINAYKEADLFVLPTYSENFGMVVAEALINECPAIVGKGAPWSSLDSRKCGWWVSNDADSLAKTLEEAMSCSPEERRAMGQRGREWMLHDFCWESITKRMIASYEWLNNQNQPTPAWIRLV